MFLRKKPDSTQVIEEEKEPQCLIIHFTPATIFIYHSKEDQIYADSGVVTFCDMEGNRIEIGGTFIVLEIEDERKIHSIKENYGLNASNLPIIEINIQEY